MLAGDTRVSFFRQAQVDDDSQDEGNDKRPDRNNSHDVAYDDVDRITKSVERHLHAHNDNAATVSASRPRRPATDDRAQTVGAPVRPVPPVPSSRHSRDPQPSAPVVAAAAAAASSVPIPVDRRASERTGCSYPSSRSPDDERRMYGQRRPQSSPTGRRLNGSGGGGLASYGRMESIGGVGSAAADRRAAVTRANTTGGYLLQVPDVVYPSRTPSTASDAVDTTSLSTSLPDRWPSAGASTRHAPRVYYSNSEDRVSATDAESRAIVPSLPYSPCASPGESPRLRRQPTRETRRLSVTETDEGWTQLNQYKLKDEIGKVGCCFLYVCLFLLVQCVNTLNHDQ